MSVTVMLGGDPGAGSDHIKWAIQLCQRRKSSLTGLLIMPDPSYIYAYSAAPHGIIAGNMATASLVEAQERARQAFAAAFNEETKKAGSWLQSTLVDEQGHMLHRASGAAMLSDALVFPHGAAGAGHGLNPAFENVLMEAGLPVVLAAKPGINEETCLIAWDGSPQAARAVRFHLPLIETYQRVVIAQNPEKLRMISRRAAMADPAKLSAYLNAKRIETDTVVLDGAISEGLLATADAHKAGLLVMGAYGHSRMGEMIFGGTSRALLNEETGPALALAH